MYRLDLKIRLHNGPDIALGPGKADLLEAIVQHGSISGAARAMGMSYRRAWLLVETMNRSFRQPLVSTQPGGKHGGGTQLTATGEQVLQRYRALRACALAAIEQECAALAELLADPAAEGE